MASHQQTRDLNESSKKLKRCGDRVVSPCSAGIRPMAR